MEMYVAAATSVDVVSMLVTELFLGLPFLMIGGG